MESIEPRVVRWMNPRELDYSMECLDQMLAVIAGNGVQRDRAQIAHIRGQTTFESGSVKETVAL